LDWRGAAAALFFVFFFVFFSHSLSQNMDKALNTLLRPGKGVKVP
jgi:hypothetical protein